MKKLCRAAAITLAAVLAFGQTAFADNVMTAEAPGGNSAAVTGTSSGVQAGNSAFGVENADGSKGGFISATGPSETKNLTSEGYLIIGSGNDAYSGKSSVIGPGQGTAQAAAATPAASQAQTAAAAALTIPANIEKPSVSGDAAVLYDATTRQILFEKNGNKAEYPASTTKLLTALLAAERLNMEDVISFSSTAVNNLESGAVTANMKVGDTMTVKDAMYAMLLRSACEVSNAVAEKVSGTQADFAALMNQRAAELGCSASHFANASGLNDNNHYTTAADMALITAAAIANPTVRGILQTRNYTLPATGSRGTLAVTSGNKMLSGASEAYTDYIGGKTGYTSKAGNCLSGAAAYKGHELVAVVLKANSSHYADSRKLFDYGKKIIDANQGGTAAGVTVTSSASATAASPTASQSSAAASPAASGSGTAASASGKWIDNGNGTWKYQKGDGSYCTNEWLTVNGNTYFFGGDALMVTGWKQFTNSDWYYFNPENGAMVSGKWVRQNNKSYYLQNNGVMAKNTVIDGMYRVNENGVYVEKVG